MAGDCVKPEAFVEFPFAASGTRDWAHDEGWLRLHPSSKLRFMISASDQASETTTHFGYETVPVVEKAGRVRAVFDAVAPRYDLMNDLMSGGIHRLWKQAMLDWLAPGPGWHVLDVAGGTGDIAFRILDRLDRSKPSHDQSRVTVCDVNQTMIDRGRDRALDSGYVHGLDWVAGDAQALPFPDMHFDAYTIAFGLRNVTSIDDALAEALRVLKPGGRFLCLEFSAVKVAGLKALYDRYSFTVLPRLGQVIAGDGEAYRYLAESIRRFPDQESLAALMTGAGFDRVKVRNLSGGVAALHSGWRL